MNDTATWMGGGMAQDCNADRDGFAAMLTVCEPIVRKVSRTYCWDSELRRDLAQEILLALWRSWPRYDRSRPAGSWVYRVALNVAIDYVRYSTRRSPPVALDADIADETRLDQQVDDAIILERIIRAAEPFDRAILLLFLEGHSHTEIAAVVGTTESNVSTRLHRLKAGLSAQYKEVRT